MLHFTESMSIGGSADVSTSVFVMEASYRIISCPGKAVTAVINSGRRDAAISAKIRSGHIQPQRRGSRCQHKPGKRNAVIVRDLVFTAADIDRLPGNQPSR